MQDINKSYFDRIVDQYANEGFKISTYDSICHIDKAKYNSIVDDENPFLEYEFLEALEKSGCVGVNTGWVPKYLILSARERIIGAITFYLKYDSYGEFIFDWEWAQAYQNAGLSYYPKIVVAIPFTPANGVRILIEPGYAFDKLAKFMVEFLIEFSREKQISSIHFLYLTERERNLLETLGFLTRKTHQYHWNNKHYKCFDDFLDDLRSNRKKQIRKERRLLLDQGIDITVIEKDEIKPEHIDAMWEFYLNTMDRKWGRPYLNRRFFELIYENFRHRLVMVMARDKGRWVGGSFNIVKNNRLFGRYWGTIKEYKNLHFECCYYRLIEYAISNKIDVFEAGAQGEHKFLRGFGAVPTYSSHSFFHQGAHKAIEKFLIEERSHTTRLIDDFNRISPLKHLHR